MGFLARSFTNKPQPKVVHGAVPVGLCAALQQVSVQQQESLLNIVND